MTKPHGIGWLNKPGFTGKTWNPIVGCSIESAGCTNCYAMSMARRIEAMQPGSHYAGTTKVVSGNPVWTGKIARASDKTRTAPLLWSKPCMVFINSMGDLFHPDVSDKWIDEVMAVVALSPQHIFVILTKRPERMRGYFSTGRAAPVGIAALRATMKDILTRPKSKVGECVILQGDIPHLQVWPLPNLWLGVSAENQEQADQRIPVLLDISAAKRIVSYEPALGPVDFTDITSSLFEGGPEQWDALDKADAAAADPPAPTTVLNWIICGGESGTGRRPFNPDWARVVRDQCEISGVPFFMKQMGDGSDIPADLQVQQWPGVTV